MKSHWFSACLSGLRLCNAMGRRLALYLSSELREECKPENLRRYPWIALGTAVTAVAVDWLIKPSGLVSGGATGLAILLNRLTGLPEALPYSLITLTGITIESVLLGARPGLRSAFGTVSFILFLHRFSWLSGVPLTHDPLVALVPATLMASAGLTLVMANGSTTGGTGPLANLMAAWFPGITAAQFMFLIDVLIVTLLAGVYGVMASLLGAVLTLVLWGVADFLIPLLRGRCFHLIVPHRGRELAAALYRQNQQRRKAGLPTWSPTLLLPGQWMLPLGVWVEPADAGAFRQWVFSCQPEAKFIQEARTQQARPGKAVPLSDMLPAVDASSRPE